MGITPNDMLKISKDMKKAKEDTTPHAGVVDDNIFVFGDANKTENKEFDYKALLRYPKEYAEYIPEEDILQFEGNSVWVEMEFKNVHISPRNDLKIVANMAQVLPFFKKFEDDGGTREFTDDELIQIAKDVSDEVLDAMYTVVGSVLGLDAETTERLHYASVLGLMGRFLRDFPEVFNEADFS